MRNNKSFMRIVVAIAICLAGMTTFSGCKKEKDTGPVKCKITGKVYTSKSGVIYLIQGANVYLNSIDHDPQYYRFAKTNADGIYSFSEAFEGIQYNLHVSEILFDGPYCRETDTFNVSKNQTITKDIYLFKCLVPF